LFPVEYRTVNVQCTVGEHPSRRMRMHRRMSLGLALVLLMVFLAGATPASATPLAKSEASTAGTLELLNRMWEWLVSVVASNTTSGPGAGAGPLNGFEGGMFIDPNGGNS
jgi:hypothetical protein